MKYNVDILMLIKQLLPFRLRLAHVISFVHSILFPLQYIHDSLVSYRDKKQYELSISPQVIYLEKLLNDTFNPLSAYDDIYITDSRDFDILVYMGNEGEQEAGVYFGNQYLPFISYSTGDEVIYDGITWKAIQDVSGITPGTNPSYWVEPGDESEEAPYIGNASEYNLGVLFTVNINQALHDQLTVDNRLGELDSLINQYKMFSSTHKIVVV